jgi:uncharacterized membrane protein YjjB (DUF3815 family)
VNGFWLHLFHQSLFGGIAAAGFGILFNCPPGMIWQCFSSGAVALAIRTACQGANLDLAEASFAAALVVATVERVLQEFQSSRGSILSLVGCIPMVPGSIAAKGLMDLYAMPRAHPNEEILVVADAMKNLFEVTFTLAAIGTGLAIPRLLYPRHSTHAG